MSVDSFVMSGRSRVLPDVDSRSAVTIPVVSLPHLSDYSLMNTTLQAFLPQQIGSQRQFPTKIGFLDSPKSCSASPEFVCSTRGAAAS